MNSNKKVPKLRFPEYKDTAEWDEIKLKQFATFYRGLTYGKSDISNKGTLVLRSGNIQNERLVLNKDLVFVEKECASELKLLEGDVVVCMSNGSKSLVGKNAEYKGEYDGKITVGAFCSIMRPKNKFTKYLLQSDSYQNFVALSIGGGNINNLKNSDLEDFKCNVPKDPHEQQKIADCLSSIEDVINLYSQKLEFLEDHKKGLIQNLFPHEGEFVPNFRFPEFVKDGYWVSKKLGDEADFLKGKGISKADISLNGEIPCIRYGELYTTYRETISKVVSYTNLPKSDLVFSKENDVIIPASGETQIDIATASCIINKDIAIGGDLNIIRSKNNGVFLSYYLNNVKKYAIAHMAQGNAVVHLYGHQLKTLEIMLPKEIDEQKKIADCLSSLDNLTKGIAEKIEQLKEHKKGLLQDLFPKIEI